MCCHIKSIFVYYKGRHSFHIMADVCCADLCTDCDCGDLCSNACGIMLCYQCSQNGLACDCNCGKSSKKQKYMAAPQNEPKQQRMTRDAELVF